MSDAGAAPAVAALPRGLDPARAARARWRRTVTPVAIIGAALVGIVVAVALAAPVLAPHPPAAQIAKPLLPPGATHLLGTDEFGRDELSRLIWGARVSLYVGGLAVLIALGLGATAGVIAGFFGGWVDEIVSRLMDAFISIPSKMLAMVMVAAFGSSVGLLILTAAFSYTPGAFRIARSLAVNVKTLEYVQAARARGERLPYIARVEILPNMVNPMLADFGLRFVFVVLLLSGMSFLGLGVQPPDADLGSLVRENISGLFEGAPAVVMPAIAIATLTVSVNLLIDSLSGRSTRAAEN